MNFVQIAWWETTSIVQGIVASVEKKQKMC